MFRTYEGFGLITNATADLRTPEEIKQAKEYALAEAARSFFGNLGISIMAIATLFFTGSAVNATLYGGANVGMAMSRKGQLPASFRKRLWAMPEVSLLYTSMFVIALAVTLPIEKIAMAGSLSFLVIYGAVNAAHLKLLHETKACAAYVWIGLLGCIAGTLTLSWYILEHSPEIFIIFAGFVVTGIIISLLMQTRRSKNSDQA